MTYNTLSTLACASIAYGYIRHGRMQGPKLPFRLPGSSIMSPLFKVTGLIGVAHMAPKLQSPFEVATRIEQATDMYEDEPKTRFKARCPFDFAGAATESEVYGLKRVSRHPYLWSFAFLMLSKGISTVYVTEAVMFSMPTLLALIGGAHQDYRYRRGSGGHLSEETDAVTSNVPFIALFTGKQSWEDLSKEIKHLNALIAVIVSALI